LDPGLTRLKSVPDLIRDSEINKWQPGFVETEGVGGKGVVGACLARAMGEAQTSAYGSRTHGDEKLEGGQAVPSEQNSGGCSRQPNAITREFSHCP